MENLDTIFFCWSIISTILGVIFLLADVGLLVFSIKESNKNKALIKIWQHYSEGLDRGLRRVIENADTNRYTKIQDVRNTVQSLQEIAFSLHRSLYDEYTLTPKEHKKEHEEMMQKIKTK